MKEIIDFFISIGIENIVLPSITVIVTFFAAYWTLESSRGGRTAQFISQNRIEWLQKLREYVAEYIRLIDTEKASKESIKNMQDITIKVKLHLNYNGKVDEEILRIMDEINKTYKKANLFSELSEKGTKEQYDVMQNEAFKELMQLYSVIETDEIVKITGNSYDECRMRDSKLFTEDNIEKFKVYAISDLNETMKKLATLEHVLLILTQIYLKCEWDRIKYEIKEGNLDKFKYNARYTLLRKEKEDDLKKFGYTNIIDLSS